MNNLHCPQSFLISVAFLRVSPSDAVCPHLYCLSSIVLACLCFFPSNLVRSSLRGLRSTGQPGLLLTWLNHRSLHWTTLSSKVVWPTNNACLKQSFLIFCSLETPAIFRSQIISAVRIS